MAVKRVEKAVEVEVQNEEVNVEVETTPEVETETPEVEIPEVETTPDVETTLEVEIPEVEVEEQKKSDDVEVDTKSAEVKESNRPNGNVKIRMRADHRCCIAMERYDLKAGKTYTVPENVKRILNEAGLLAPL